MANIIAKIGASMAKNRIEVKAILDKYNIPAGDSNSDRIKAAFTAIKAGNTALATDLAALSTKSSFGSRLKNDLDKFKAKVEEAKSRVIAKPASGNTGIVKPKADSHATVVTASNPSDTIANADGAVDVIAADSAELINTVNSTDINASVNEASASANAADSSETKAIVILLVIAAVIVIVLFDPFKYFKHSK